MAALVDELRQVPLFGGLGQRHLRRLAHDFKARSFKAGTSILRQGEMSGVGFFIIRDGNASVSIDGEVVARLGPGDYFGELALISERARMATVTAETDVACLDISFWNFRRFVKSSPDVAWKLLQRVVDLLAESDQRARSRR